MNYNNSIILTHYDNSSSGRRGKFVIDKDWILGVVTMHEREYAKDTVIEKTYIHIPYDKVEVLGINKRAVEINRDVNIIPVAVEENINVIFGLLKGSKAAEILHGQK